MSANLPTDEGALLKPVSGAERVDLIDVLRGFALLGILLVNFGDEVNFGGRVGESMPAVNAVVRRSLNILVSGSFFPLFSFLFGLGFSVQMLRARERGSGFVLIYVRRMLALFLIGTFHAVVIRSGDVLVSYAFLGLVLIPLHRIPDRWLLPLPLLIVALQLYGTQVRAFVDSIGGGARAAEVRELRGVAHGDQFRIANAQRLRLTAQADVGRAELFSATGRLRWLDYAGIVRGRLSRDFFLNYILPFFILGLIAGRRRILQEAEQHRRALAWTAGVAAAAAIAGNLLIFVFEIRPQPILRLAHIAQNLGATIFYLAAISLSFVSLPRVAKALRIFAVPGQIALTNYLLQSTVVTLLFAKYGAGLSKPGATICLLLALVMFFGLQVPFSRWWVARFRFGPAEWLWRSMTYGTRQPLRRAVTPPI